MKKTNRKLALTRVAIKPLTTHDLARAGGGYVIQLTAFCTLSQQCGGGYTIDTNVISEIKSNCATVCYLC